MAIASVWMKLAPTAVTVMPATMGLIVRSILMTVHPIPVVQMVSALMEYSSCYVNLLLLKFKLIIIMIPLLQRWSSEAATN